MAELSNIALIEKYVNYELTEAEELLLKNRLQSDEDFKAEFELAVFLHAQDRVGQRAHYKNVFENSEIKAANPAEKNNAETPVIPIENPSKKIELPVLFKWLKLVAALIIIPALSVLLYQNVYSLDSAMTKILASEKENLISVGNRGGNSINPKYLNAIEAYNRKAFQEANQFFKIMESDTTLTLEQNFYYAKSLLFVEAYSEANIKFGVIIDNPNPDASRFHEACKWYKALALLKLDKQDEAATILTKLLELEEGDRGKKINSLLKKLN